MGDSKSVRIKGAAEFEADRAVGGVAAVLFGGDVVFAAESGWACGVVMPLRAPAEVLIG